MKLRIDSAAETDLREAAAWYERQRTGLGLELLAEVDSALQRIRRAPYQHSKLETMPHEDDVRRAILGRFPYAVVYEIAAEEIHVLAVAHTCRRPNYWLHRR